MRWQLEGDGICWRPEAGCAPHCDNLEMSGMGVSLLTDYGVDENGLLHLSHHVVWPMLRTIPNNTHASWQTDFGKDLIPRLLLDGAPAAQTPVCFALNGVLRVTCRTDCGALVTHTVFPSAGTPENPQREAVEILRVENKTDRPIDAAMAGESCISGAYVRGTRGIYRALIRRWGDKTRLAPGEHAVFVLTYTACVSGEAVPEPMSDAEALARLTDRERRADALMNGCAQLDTGIPVLDRMYALAKLRAGESIFATRGGLLHSPGGCAYYAATWCNDQIEYAGPWFAFAGDPIACKASLNAYNQYMPFMSDLWLSIPSSIIAEGTDIWEKDRGDEAMYAYGASLFCLYRGELETARHLYPAIRWCIEFCLRRRTADGVIASETDELEGRFPTGDANLSTSSLCYGGMRSAAILADELGFPEDAARFRAEAEQLAAAIESHFGANLHGFDTYRYYAEGDRLRSWICLPMVMGISTRQEGTLNALTSPYLWTEDGVRTEEGCDTIWDRSTLYGIRGAFRGGAGNQVYDCFLQYSTRRLLGEHVPYAVESNGEGRHIRQLSAESALYCRVFTEGLLALEPTSLHSFSICPRLPDALDHLYLRRVCAFGAIFDIEADHNGCRVLRYGQILAQGAPGERLHVRFD